jgi:HEAT repeat protein
MLRRFLIGFLVSLLASMAIAETPIHADFLMGTDPEIRGLEKVRDFRKDFRGLWQQALRRPEADYQRLAAETISRGHKYGIPGLSDLVPDLENVLTLPESHPAARFASARALIVLDHQQSAQKLFDTGLKYGSDLRQLTEPAIAVWDFQPARTEWIKRLDQKDVYPRDLILAMRCLGKVREAAALKSLTGAAMDVHRQAAIRLEAAAAAGEIVEAGLESNAQQLADESRGMVVINRLCALRLLARHNSENTCDMLMRLAGENDATVAVTAIERLMTISPDRAVTLADAAVSNSDARVRKAGVAAYSLRPSTERIPLIAAMLSDEHPMVRETACSSLCQLAKETTLQESVLSSAMEILHADRWQGQVQAALVLGTLEHLPAAARFSELLDSPRPEVQIHAAWGLRKLAVPETVPIILSTIRKRTEERRKENRPGLDEMVAHLFEACARMKVIEARDILLMYVPKSPLPGDTRLCRRAANWALGHLYEGNPDETVSEALIARVLDDADQPKEVEIVKYMAVLSLVRMKAVDQGSSLKASLSIHPEASALDLATRWAVLQLTGEKLPDPNPPVLSDGEWFLEPLEP